ncbi:uncharacterized protein LOC123988926 [Osmia bicornis bicornis]|uniref:uncharacterized protein LOC123988926 n=1 Tax=Osmia bicornis bicornis TaxID=1437191 RepID=UPI001EAEF6F3|nr:uncharacterized protein LOC123988926 [Osmia bicornis bicornis]
MTPATTRNRMNMLKEAYQQCQDLDAKIVAMADLQARSTLQYFVDNHFERCEECYQESLDYMSEILDKTSSTQETASEKGNLQPVKLRSQSLLPQIQLPSFDGTFEQWESFRDKFQSIVINDNSLSNVERLHFLCSALTGDAKKAVNHLPTTDANFEVAWQLVKNRYENKRRLLSTYLNNLFSLPQVTSESAKELRSLGDQLNVSIHGLKNLKRPVEHWDDVLVFLGTQKLDRSSRKAWELQFGDTSELSTYVEFDKFLESRVRALESMSPIKTDKPENVTVKSKPKTISTNTSTVSPIICPALEPSERFKLIKSQRRCVNCFSAKHAKEQCHSQRSCKECKQRHHTLLHFPIKPEQSSVSQSNQTSATNPNSELEISSNSASRTKTNTGILLSTARIRVHSLQGRTVQARALLDQGSVATLISENLAQILRLPRNKQNTCITGIGGIQSWANHTARITITPLVRTEPVYSTTAIILKTLTQYTPKRHSSVTNWNHIAGLELADTDPMSSDPIDIVIGADLFGQLLLDGVRKGSTSEPIAQNTHLGWILSGPTSTHPLPFFIDAHHATLLENLDADLRRFWEVENIPTQSVLSPEEEKCELHFQSSHTRTSEGRYIVRLPFKSEPPIDLGESRFAAMKTLLSLERRFKSDQVNTETYKEFLSEYEALGHMERVPTVPVQTTNQIYYIPHHAVLRESSSTTRLRVLAVDEGHQYPLALPVLKDQTYVDDCLFGADDKDLLRTIRDQTINLLNKGGFRLRKWASNDPTLLIDIDPRDHGLAKNKLLKIEETCSVLGLEWNPVLDHFQFRVTISSNFANTKRTILSQIAKLFDPMGLLTPVVIPAKVFMQKLWSLQYDWDDILPNDVLLEWQDYYTHLPDLNKITIPRKIANGIALHQEIHGFADASTKAYAASVYIKSVLPDDNVFVALLVAKSRVAPVKTLSIPRLELCAAALLARLVVFVENSLSLIHHNVHCWTDSSITLAWLSQPPTRWKTFVANRVSKIQSLLPKAQWHHVPTNSNPADCATRGLTPSELKIHSIWWSGPSWLKQGEERWPKSNIRIVDSHEEEKIPKLLSAVSTTDPWDLPTRYSSWSKLLRVTAYILRFTSNLRFRHTNKIKLQLTIKSLIAVPPLQPDEIQRAKFLWLRRMQSELFPDELSSLSAKKTLLKSSKLLSLNPILDQDGLIRAKGRLAHSLFPENTKKPIILRSHPLLSLIINHTHVIHLHAGSQLTLACLRPEYWILRARTTIRSVLHRCVPCARHRASVPSELMGDLPASRVTAVERPFINTGVDYAGPIHVRTTSGRGHKSHKAYIAVFVCMATKAVYLDLVSDYTSAAFLAAYTRFVSRRGIPKSMYSDNGTTFQGANKELRKAHRESLRDTNLHNKLAVDGVAWHFLRPSAPHFGGLWEAAVKSVKHHLRRSIGTHTLSFEELTTVLCRIEAALNSRPLVAMSDCIDDYNALTPGHFLIGSALTSIPEPSVLQLKENRLSRWQLIQRITETFWKAWHTEYLHTLHQRPKWRVAQNLTKIGQLVLLRNECTPPAQWELARIIDCHPGTDGIIRVVTIKTANSTYKRPISKLRFLPIDINVESDAQQSS